MQATSVELFAMAASQEAVSLATQPASSQLHGPQTRAGDSATQEACEGGLRAQGSKVRSERRPERERGMLNSTNSAYGQEHRNRWARDKQIYGNVHQVKVSQKYRLTATQSYTNKLAVRALARDSLI